jgi:hypothetical protein
MGLKHHANAHLYNSHAVIVYYREIHYTCAMGELYNIQRSAYRNSNRRRQPRIKWLLASREGAAQREMYNIYLTAEDCVTCMEHLHKGESCRAWRINTAACSRRESAYIDPNGICSTQQRITSISLSYSLCISPPRENIYIEKSKRVI